MSVKLFDYQLEAVNNMKNGCVLIGGVGSGKSLTALAYYFVQQRGRIDPFEPLPPNSKPQDLIIITTAQKRDTNEWDKELSRFLFSADEKQTKKYGNKVIIDSWNVIHKYTDIKGAMFLFDEQRACGSGKWSKAFIKIAKHNNWVLLSASPADTWSDLIPVFIANGFFRNRTDFNSRHVIYSRFAKYPKIEGYRGTGYLMKLRNSIYVDMDFKRKTIAHHEDVYVQYDTSLYKEMFRTRWNPWTNEPMLNAAELCYCARKVVNSDISRQVKLLEILEDHPRAIIFYNFDYERDILLNLAYGDNVEIAEYSGHAHQKVPTSEKWVYLVNFSAGNAGWNCIATDTIIFYSQSYSYKVMLQSAGRIDRLNTPFTDLYYYHIRSRSGIDLAISKALKEKKNFNETKWAGW